MRDLIETNPGRLGDRTPVSTLAGSWSAYLGSLNTRQAYRRHLVGFCDEHGVESSTIARPGLDLYARQLHAAGKSPATVARRLSALASFFNYLVDEQVIPTSPVERPISLLRAADIAIWEHRKRPVGACAVTGLAPSREGDR